MWANNHIVTLNWFQGLSVKMAPADLARWTLKQVQHDIFLVMA